MQHLGRYRIEEEIGRGAFAVVYKAIDSHLGRAVALKIMRPILMGDSVFVRRFQREAKTIAQLEHPHIIPIYDIGEEDGRFFIAMKLMRGSLRDQLNQGTLSWEQTLSITKQVGSALDFAHAKGIIHRDIKPENILIDPLGHAVITDFGIVKTLQSTDITRTISGGILGTPNFMAPELWDDMEASATSDIYALACTVYELLSGKSLFNASTPLATMAKHYKGAVLPPQWPESAPKKVKDALMIALAKDPATRYQSAQQFTVALETYPEDLLEGAYDAFLTEIEVSAWDNAITHAGVILQQNINYRDVQTRLTYVLGEKQKAQQPLGVLHNNWWHRAFAHTMVILRQNINYRDDQTTQTNVLEEKQEAQQILDVPHSNWRRRVFKWLCFAFIIVCLTFISLDTSTAPTVYTVSNRLIWFGTILGIYKLITYIIHRRTVRTQNG
ncbi:MAG: serine/threonine-protein kinase [Candidatus Promineifilaceae bacterium]